MKIVVLGSGNWGTAISKLIATNIASSETFNQVLHMWTYEELIGTEKITDIINSTHVNVKYLPGVTLPKNLLAVPELECAYDADILVFVTPHQFVGNICGKLKGKLKEGCIGVSLIKGFEYSDGKINLISEYIQNELGIRVGVLMGANIASEVAKGVLSEGTLACKDKGDANLLFQIFNCYNYRVTVVEDVQGVELNGTLKNVVAIAYGITEGLKHGYNTRAAVLRTGFKEIYKFYELFYPNTKTDTLFESSGIGDLIVSCLVGRNYKFGVELATLKISAEEFEKNMGGQKLQGTLTSKDVYSFLKTKELCDVFPLFCTVYKICYENEVADAILSCITSQAIDEE